MSVLLYIQYIKDLFVWQLAGDDRQAEATPIRIYVQYMRYKADET